MYKLASISLIPAYLIFLKETKTIMIIIWHFIFCVLLGFLGNQMESKQKNKRKQPTLNLCLFPSFLELPDKSNMSTKKTNRFDAKKYENTVWFPRKTWKFGKKNL